MSTTPRAGRPQDHAIRQRIIDATLELLSSEGAESLTFDAIAARAQTSRPAIYRRWKIKEDLIAEAIETQRPKLIAPNTGTLRGDLHEAAEAFLVSYGTPLAREAIMSIVHVTSRSQPVSKVWASKYGMPRMKDFRSIFNRAIDRGELAASADIDTIMYILSSVLLQSCLLKDADPRLSSHKTVNDVIEFLLMG